jgi:hypothetical protein
VDFSAMFEYSSGYIPLLSQPGHFVETVQRTLPGYWNQALKTQGLISAHQLFEGKGV